MLIFAAVLLFWAFLHNQFTDTKRFCDAIRRDAKLLNPGENNV